MNIKLKDIRIEGYRQLKKLSVSGLGDVNLIVGGNNSGKSTFLEALRIFSARGAPSLIEDLLVMHGEYQASPLDSAGEPSVDRSLANLFYGRVFPDVDGDGIYIGSDDGSYGVSIDHVLLREYVDEREIDGELALTRRLRRISKEDASLDPEVVEALEIKNAEGAGLFGPIYKSISVPLADFFGNTRRLPRARFDDSMSPVPVSFLPFKATGRDVLAEAWDEVVLTDGEKFVLKALKLIEPRTQALAFIQGGRSRPGRVPGARVDERFAVIRVDGVQSPVPLQSMGDGMTRVLQLVLSAIKARGGFLLIDEFENGLHYSVQEQVWRLLFELAEINGTQVFVTTHSSDCVNAFSKVAISNPKRGVLIRMDRDADGWDTTASVVQYEQLDSLIGAGVEVR